MTLYIFMTYPCYVPDLSLLCSQLILITFLTYPDAVYKPLYLPSSSSVCKLMLIHLLSYILSKSPLYSQVSLCSLVALLVLW